MQSKADEFEQSAEANAGKINLEPKAEITKEEKIQDLLFSQFIISNPELVSGLLLQFGNIKPNHFSNRFISAKLRCLKCKAPLQKLYKY